VDVGKKVFQQPRLDELFQERKKYIGGNETKRKNDWQAHNMMLSVPSEASRGNCIHDS